MTNKLTAIFHNTLFYVYHDRAVIPIPYEVGWIFIINRIKQGLAISFTLDSKEQESNTGNHYFETNRIDDKIVFSDKRYSIVQSRVLLHVRERYTYNEEKDGYELNITYTKGKPMNKREGEILLLIDEMIKRKMRAEEFKIPTYPYIFIHGNGDELFILSKEREKSIDFSAFYYIAKDFAEEFMEEYVVIAQSKEDLTKALLEYGDDPNTAVITTANVILKGE